MNLRVVGCNYRTAAVELREKLAFDAAKQDRAVSELTTRFGCEVVLLSTCNRVELYTATRRKSRRSISSKRPCTWPRFTG